MYRKRYSAFTLIEMLIVMSILVILGGLSFSAYQNMQVTIRLNEFTNTLEENIRRVQREAMLLKRYPGENWIYGIGIDFSKTDKAETWGDYEVFKWCAEETEYGGERTSSSIPGYSNSYNHNGGHYGEGNGVLPGTILANKTRCTPDMDESRVGLSGYDIGLAPPKGRISFSFAQAIGIDEESEIRYMLFESVTGRAFFYNQGGSLIGYEQLGIDSPKIGEEGVPSFSIFITPASTGVQKQLTVQPFSGKVTVGIKEDE